MREENIILNSKCDNLPISVTIFMPNGDIKGIFQIAHGMCEHKKRYYDFMKYLTNKGYITIINDHRGHGESILKKDDLGYFYDNTSDYIVEDLHQITEYIKQKYPNKKLTLFGHSMGSMVVRKYIKKYDNEIDKLIVCGSPSKNTFVDFGILFVKIQQIFKGDRYRSDSMQNISLSKNKKDKKETNSSTSWICDNSKTIEKYEKDELCGFTFTLNGFENLFKLMKSIYTKSGWVLNNKELPIFFVAGSEDPIIISKEKWIKSQDFLKEIGYVNITRKLYNNLKHEILNEENNIQIYNDILEFINL